MGQPQKSSRAGNTATDTHMMIYCLLPVVLILLFLPYLFFSRPSKPRRKPYAYILVLGCPCNEDGSCSAAQKKRISATADYLRQGYATHVILSGSAVKNERIEAECMAKELNQLLPAHTYRISLETQARNTYQNMKLTKAEYGDDPILIVTGSSHMRRAAFFARKFYKTADVGCGTQHDPWYYFIWEYTRMWVALYWEIRLFITKK